MVAPLVTRRCGIFTTCVTTPPGSTYARGPTKFLLFRCCNSCGDIGGRGAGRPPNATRVTLHDGGSGGTPAPWQAIAICAGLMMTLKKIFSMLLASLAPSESVAEDLGTRSGVRSNTECSEGVPRLKRLVKDILEQQLLMRKQRQVSHRDA